MYINFVDAIQGDERAKGRKDERTKGRKDERAKGRRGERANNVPSNWCFFTIFAA